MNGIRKTGFVLLTTIVLSACQHDGQNAVSKAAAPVRKTATNALIDTLKTDTWVNSKGHTIKLFSKRLGKFKYKTAEEFVNGKKIKKTNYWGGGSSTEVYDSRGACVSVYNTTK